MQKCAGNDFLKNPNEYTFTDGVLAKINQPKTGSAFSAAEQDRHLYLEENSWWFKHRGDYITDKVKIFFSTEDHLFDIGGGNGYNAKRIQDCGYKITLVEPSAQGCLNAVKRGLAEPLNGTLTDDDFNDESLDGVCFFDVLEHIENDKYFLNIIHKKLRKEKNIILTVPAFRILWSSEDEYLNHFRRYNIKEITKLVENAGFRVEYSSYFFSFLFLPILFIRVWAEKFGLLKKANERTKEESEQITDREFVAKSGFVGFAVNSICKLEQKWLKSFKLPFGSSIIIVAKKI